jgi:hypothetical protein
MARSPFRLTKRFFMPADIKSPGMARANCLSDGPRLKGPNLRLTENTLFISTANNPSKGV